MTIYKVGLESERLDDMMNNFGMKNEIEIEI